MAIKKIIIRFLYFLCFSSVVYVILIIVWGLFMPPRLSKNLVHPVEGYLYRRLAEVKKTENVDILFLGASTAYRSFDPRIFEDSGYTTFNLGSSAQTPEQTNILLKRYLAELNPRLVVYEVQPGLLANRGIESTIDLIANDKLDWLIFEHVVYNINMKAVNSLIFSFFSSVFSVENVSQKVKIPEDKYVSGGYVETSIQNDSILVPSGKRILEPRKDQMEALRRNLRYIKDRNIPFILVRAPLPSYTFKAIKNNFQLDNRLHQLGPYINFQDKVKLQELIDFADEVHLNRSGAKKFSEKFLDYLEEQPILAD